MECPPSTKQSSEDKIPRSPCGSGESGDPLASCQCRRTGFVLSIVPRSLHFAFSILLFAIVSMAFRRPNASARRGQVIAGKRFQVSCRGTADIRHRRCLRGFRNKKPEWIHHHENPQLRFSGRRISRACVRGGPAGGDQTRTRSIHQQRAPPVQHEPILVDQSFRHERSRVHQPFPHERPGPHRPAGSEFSAGHLPARPVSTGSFPSGSLSAGSFSTGTVRARETTRSASRARTSGATFSAPTPTGPAIASQERDHCAHYAGYGSCDPDRPCPAIF